MCGLPGLQLWEGVCEAPGAAGPLLKALAGPTRHFTVPSTWPRRRAGRPSCWFAKEETCGAKLARGQSRLQSGGEGVWVQPSDSRKEGARIGTSPARVEGRRLWRNGGWGCGGPAPASSPGLSPQDHRAQHGPLRPSPAAGGAVLSPAEGAEVCLPSPWAGPPPSRALGTPPRLDTHPPCCGSRGSGAKFPCAGMRRGWGEEL